MNRHNLPLARHAAMDIGSIGLVPWVMIANSSNCLISPVQCGWPQLRSIINSKQYNKRNFTLLC